MVMAVWFLVFLVGLGRWLWRLWHDEEELQPGGSIGRQLFSRDKT